jgi:hypothetical protein
LNPWVIARPVAGIFFPQREALGFDSRECTPQLVRVTMHVAAESRSFERAATLLERILGDTLSAKSIERLVKQVGEELSEEQPSTRQVVAPEVAVVSSDGGRIHTRELGHGPGVHRAHWRETKCASFEKMTAPAGSAVDPCPTLPDTFRQVAHVAKIAETAAFQAESPLPRQSRYQGPKRILRTCLSSLVNSDRFGPRMEREARRRSFYAASRRVYLGDGLPWNWTIQRTYFPTFTPILDFIHAIQYLYAAARAWETTDACRWSRYLELTEAVWQGRVGDVIEQLQGELARRQIAPDDDLSDGSPHEPLVTATRYLDNNRLRMDYPRYRREGLPITSAPMESLIKQINHRVKGTEMTWNDPAGAEAILQLRAASLCEDGRLDDYLRQRLGCPLVRRPILATAT